MQSVDPPVPTETSKMNQGGEELRDHDFPVPSAHQGEEAGKGVAPPSSSPDPDQGEIRSGGQHGTVAGDRQPYGETPAIMDQDKSTPDLASQH